MPQLKQFAAKSPEASHLRRRKYKLVRQFGLPENLVGGAFGHNRRRCGRPNCHCANGQGHPAWSVTFSHKGKRRVERIPREWVEELEAAVLATQTYMDAIREVMAINIELLAQTRAEYQQKKVRRRQKKARAHPTNDQLLPPSVDLLNM